MDVPHVPEAEAPGPGFRGWWIAGGLGVTVAVAYGVLSYAFPVFIDPMSAELGWSQATITGAFSLATLMAGLAAVPTGIAVDRIGPRAVMVSGTLMGTLALVLWSQTASVGGFYLAAGLMGLAMATTFYEPAFAVAARWFSRFRGRALTVLTVVGGLSSIIFVPLASLLVEVHGWRPTLLVLGGVLAGVTLPIHGLLTRNAPEEVGLGTDGDHLAPTLPSPSDAALPRDPPPTSPPAASRGSFAWLAASFGMSAAVSTAIAIHFIPLLLERGYSLPVAGTLMGVLGLMALPGRLLIAPRMDRRSAVGVSGGVLAMMGVGLLVLTALPNSVGIWSFIVLFGAGAGVLTPARGALIAELYGSASYGTLSGALALPVALSRAAAPVGGSLLYAASGDYRTVLLALLALVGVSILFLRKVDSRAGKSD